MSKVNVFDLVKSISNESVSHPEVNEVKVDGKADLPDNVQEDTNQECADDNVDAEVTNTQTSEPGPANGGGDGTADFQAAAKEKVHVDTKDLHFDGDQNGGRHVDTLPSQAKAKDNLKPSDITHSVEDHTGEDDSLKTMDAAGAETVGAADDLVMDIDAATEETAAAGILTQTEIDHEVMGKILTDIGELETAKASVEGYLNILTSMEKRGVEMSNELRRSISIGLESISQELFANEIITLEEFRVSNEANGVALRGGGAELDDDTEFDGARDKTSKGLVGKLMQIYEALKAAIGKAIKAGLDMWNSYVTDTTKLKEHLSDLKKRASKLEGGKEIAIRNTSRLMLGDEFVGNSTEALKRLRSVSKTFLLEWPSKLVGLNNELRRFLDKEEGDISELRTKYHSVITNTFGSWKKLSGGVSEEIIKAPGVYDIHWSEKLPGNKAMYVGLKDADAGATINDMIEFRFTEAHDARNDKTDATIETPTGGEASSVIRELEQMVSEVAGYKEGMERLKKQYEEVSNIIAKQGMDAVKSKDGGRLGAAILAIDTLKVSAEHQHQFVGYLISTVKAYIGFLEGAIKTEGAE